MRHNLISTGQWLITALLLAISLGAYGCADTVSISEDVSAPLSSLTVTPGTLQPAFSANTTNYTVNAPTSSASVTVTAVPQDNTATVTINGTVTAAGQGRSVPLGPPGSTTTILVVVETQNGLETTYTVTVTRLLSSDNNLSVLTVTPGTLNPSPFNADTLDYTVNVATNVTSVTVSATKSDPNAVMSGSLTAGAGAATGQATIPLGGPGTATPVTITVTAPNGSNKTYTVTVNRAASSNNNLSALTVTPGSLNPVFSSSELTYTVNVATEVTSVEVVATKSDPNAVISGSLPNEGRATIPLNGPGTGTPISITVTAQNGTPKTYNITVNRAAPSSDDKLLNLTVTPGALIPGFDPNTTTYTVIVFSSVATVTVSATKSDSNAVMQIGSVTVPAGTASGQETFPLNGAGAPPTLLSVTVTAQNGIDSETYNIEVTRLVFP